METTYIRRTLRVQGWSMGMSEGEKISSTIGDEKREVMGTIKVKQ